jgi:hypothetical protein
VDHKLLKLLQKQHAEYLSECVKTSARPRAGHARRAPAPGRPDHLIDRKRLLPRSPEAQTKYQQRSSSTIASTPQLGSNGRLRQADYHGRTPPNAGEYMIDPAILQSF